MSITRQGTIRVCLRDLSQRLARAHGVRDAYTPAEIASVLKEWDMHLSHPAYAYAIFCTRGDFERLDPAVRAGRDYEEWRQDVRRRYPRIDEISSRNVIAFARNWWPSFPVTTIDLPDSFAPEQPAPAPRPEYADRELGLRGVGLVLAAAVGAIIALALLVAWRLSA